MDSGDFWDLCRALFAVVIVLTSLTGLWRLRNWHVRTSHFQAPATIAVRKTGQLPGPLFGVAIALVRSARREKNAEVPLA